MEILPPPTFDHSYKGRLTERHGTLAEVKDYCHTRQGIVSAYQVFGCAKVFPRRCFIMIPKIGGQISGTIRIDVTHRAKPVTEISMVSVLPHSNLDWNFARKALTAFALAVGMFASSMVRAEPKDDIAALATEWAAAFSEHNVDRILKLYSREAMLWGTNGMTLRTTPEEVRGFFESAFKIPNISVSFDNQTVRLFGNVAVVAGNYTFTARPQGGPSQDSPARYSFTLVKDGERWIIVDHNSSLMPGTRGPSRRTYTRPNDAERDIATVSLDRVL
jgi:uncharacterized protein (TIGR02246 family)